MILKKGAIKIKQKKQKINGNEDRFHLWDMFSFVIWFGVLSGLVEIAFLRMKGLIGGGAVYLRCHTMWMSPVVNIAILGAVGLALLPLLRRLSLPMAVRILFIVLASIFFVNVLVLESVRLGRIHFAAKVILAVGLAIFLQRLIARRALSFERFVRRTTIFTLLLVLVLTLAVGGWYHFQERRIIAGLPESPPSAPNVLLIVLDTVRSESMSLYGYDRPTTPYLRDLAKEGTVFEHAISTSSWTLPAHVSLFTGRFHHETLTSLYRPLDDTYPTLAEALNRQGYVTGGFSANMFFCRTENGIARGFSHYEDYVASVREFVRSSSLIRYVFKRAWFRRLLGYHEPLDRKPAPRISNDFLRWVDRIPSGRPFFAFLNYMDAHEPYLPPPDFARRFKSEDQLGTYLTRRTGIEPWLPSRTTSEVIELMSNAYDGAIAYLDYNLKFLFEELRKRELFDRTLLIVVSDHGEEFGEHSVLGHGTDLHSQSIRVPLILRYPSIVPGEVIVQEPVSIREIPATVISLLGLPDAGLFPGRSLERCWLKTGSGEQESPELVLSELSHLSWAVGTPVSKGDMKSLITGDMHYIRNGDGTEEVYDLRNDPEEHNSLIQMPRGEEVAEQARRVLEQMTQ
jgi:arylsulfatase A-like enzyme